ncbi:hypothetical protein QYE76_013571 [Lolium multiflorum]|uniref:Uncharacterized protein n=1 Tax=Lolium multiflorum TaxID=4521 RepID=A0AAD8X7R8_LOLMU|nr:hypothetical protein QYE76_013571 [Lolium multiflorum]
MGTVGLQRAVEVGVLPAAGGGWATIAGVGSLTAASAATASHGGTAGMRKAAALSVHGGSNWAIRASDHRASASDRGCLQGFPHQWGGGGRKRGEPMGWRDVWSGARDGT